MFLNKLTKAEKNNFWRLAGIIVKADGKYSLEEKIVMKQYQKEMGIDKFDKLSKNADDIIKFFASRKPEIKKIVFLELLALVMCDKIYHKAEKIIIEKMVDEFRIGDAENKEFIKIVKDLNALYSKIFKIVGIRP